MKPKVSIVYDGKEVVHLTHIKCTISNTGNRAVNDQALRFPFPRGTELLEHYLDPEPKPEVRVEFSSATLDKNEDLQCRYQVGQLERGESISFNFVTAGMHLTNWEPISRTQEGSVEFHRRDVSIAKEDQEHLRPFLIFTILSLAIPPIVAVFNLGYFSDAAVVIVRLALLGALFPHVTPVIRVIERIISHYLSLKHESKIEAHAHGDQGVIMQIGGDIDGSVRFSPRTTPGRRADKELSEKNETPQQ
ncbi:hypothetical protein GCM10009634_45090 [Saccharothrix xinjiangensis]